MMVELLAAGLTGGDFSFDAAENDSDASSSTPTKHGELVLAIDPSAIGGLDTGAVLAHCERLYDRILADDGARLPSTGRHCGTARYDLRAETARDGITVPGTLLAELDALASDPARITNAALA